MDVPGMADNQAADAAAPFDMVVFGANGDLARRKLMPALFWRDSEGTLPPGKIIGASRKALDRDAYIASLEASCRGPDGDALCSQDTWRAFAERLDYVAIDATNAATYADLRDRLADGGARSRVFYLSTAPNLFGPICWNLESAGLVTPNSRVVLEKPIGRDLESAKAILDDVGAVFAEHQVFRIDHYLGKETVQNLMALRFANAMLEPIWGGNYIDHVQITVAENLGVEGRGDYYDGAGALRDMVQNHLLQLLCLIAMEPPTSLAPDTVRDEKLKVLRALRPITGEEVATKTVRGQYRAGAVEGVSVPGYLEEDGVDPRSMTETYVALKVEVENWRWTGVPFYLRTGKRLAQRVSEIIIQFKPVPHFIFDADSSRDFANRLIIRLQPDETIKLLMTAKKPGQGMELQPVHLNLSFAEAFQARSQDAYERLLLDVIRGDPTLFMRRDEVEAAWRWIVPILEGWKQDDGKPAQYVTGTWGPTKAVAMIERDDHTWIEEDF